MRRPGCCQVVASINAGTGGPAVSVPSLASELARRDWDSWVASIDSPEFGTENQLSPANYLSVPATLLSRRFRGLSPSFLHRVQPLVTERCDLVHSHGMWMAQNVSARKASQAAALPLIISPRGMMEEWSLNRSALKKRLAMAFYERSNLQTAVAFHATAESEAESIRRSLGCVPIAVIPNGIDMKPLEVRVERGILEKRFPCLKGRRWLLFMSRIHPKKGIDGLLRVWGRLSRRFPEWDLVIAGDGEREHVDPLRNDASALKARVVLTGSMEGAEKVCALQNADLFVLPTASENFGIVVAEALACGTAVITTKGAPWASLERERCGWWIERDEASLESSLQDALQRESHELDEMGRRGIELIRRDYGLSRVGEMMDAFYCWLLGIGEKPSFVDVS